MQVSASCPQTAPARHINVAKYQTWATLRHHGFTTYGNGGDFAVLRCRVTVALRQRYGNVMAALRQPCDNFNCKFKQRYCYENYNIEVG